MFDPFLEFLNKSNLIRDTLIISAFQSLVFTFFDLKFFFFARSLTHSSLKKDINVLPLSVKRGYVGKP